ncbi:MAG: tetratricopeptide repeat protein [Myxococcota bacterium]
MDRNSLEQEALQHINRGNTDGALRSYLAILKLDPRDRRIRQKVGDLYLKVGKPAEAERQFREIADALVKEGNHRAAVAVLKQLVALRPDDPLLQLELGDCYVATNYPNDARQPYETALRLLVNSGNARDAARAARKVAELQPGEPALKLRVAELLEAGGDANGAAAVYQEVADEYRRRGRPDEVGRIAEMALRIKPDDAGLLLDAAAARVEAQDWKKALVHLQVAFGHAPREPRTLDLLAKAFEGAGQRDKALKVLLELSRVGEDRGDPALEADALRRAGKLAPEDPTIRERLAAADQRVSRMERRLTALVLSQPASEDELRAQVRAEVYLRYGMGERAEGVLRAALAERPDSLPLLVAHAECLAALGRKDEAVRSMERVLPRAGGEAEAVIERIGVLKGVRVEAPPPEPELEPDDGPDPHEGAEARGDRLAEAGDVLGAMKSYREALTEDPLNDGVLGKIAALRQASRAAEAPTQGPVTLPPEAFASLGEGTFAEVSPDALDEVDAPDEDDLEEARALCAVGQYADAIVLVEHAPGLDARVLYAQALRGVGEVGRALDILREATNEASDTDPGYTDALFELSALYTATGKHRSAIRLLEELKDLDPDFRTVEVDARMRGLQKLLKA